MATAIVTVYDKFLEDLAANPSDTHTRGVMADWAEDNDRPLLAECLRWMVKNDKRPYSGSSGGGTWFNKETIADGLGDPESDLPAEIYSKLEGGNEVANHKSFPNLRAAEEAMHAAWVKAMEAGWKPE